MCLGGWLMTLLELNTTLKPNWPGRAVKRRAPGLAVRQLKRYASWVQNVVRQFGPYLPCAQDSCEDLPVVREDPGGRTAGVPIVMPMASLGSYVRNR